MQSLPRLGLHLAGSNPPGGNMVGERRQKSRFRGKIRIEVFSVKVHLAGGYGLKQV